MFNHVNKDKYNTFIINTTQKYKFDKKKRIEFSRNDHQYCFKKEKVDVSMLSLTVHDLHMLLTANTFTMPFDQVHSAHSPNWHLFCFGQFYCSHACVWLEGRGY